MAGGTVYPQEVAAAICEQAHAMGLKVHLDGARIFNAATYRNRSARELAAPFDSVMFCLSKGLGAPVGSLLCGSREFIDRAVRARKMLGGGMRQAGVLAAAGLIALEKHPAKLAEDHRNARWLAEQLHQLPGIRVDLDRVQTNIVMADVSGTGLAAGEFSKRLKECGVLINPINERQLRIVTHSDAARADCERALATMREVAP